jgi:NitT/TauT family transport system substrate-binding protein
MKKALLLFMLFPFYLWAQSLKISVEYNVHSLPAYVAFKKGLYEKNGLKVERIDSYITGVALVSAMTKGDVEVAYLCLAPAVLAFSNAGLKIKIVDQTHLYGFSVLVNPERIKNVEDLKREDLRIAVLREGTMSDLLLNYALRKSLLHPKVLKNVRRMNPTLALMALKKGEVDLAFLPEHWGSLGEGWGFRVILGAPHIWPGMPGSVIVVKEELLRKEPSLYERLKGINQASIAFIKKNPQQSEKLMLEALTESIPVEVFDRGLFLPSQEVIRRAISRCEYREGLEVKKVGEVIQFMNELGYLQKVPRPEELLLKGS